MNKPPYGNAIRLLDIAQQFKVSAQDSPNKTVKISAGSFVSGPGNIVEFNGGNTPVIAAPTSGSTWNLVSINSTGSVNVTSGATPPTVPKFSLGLALIFLKNTDQNITNDMIFDIRPIFSAHHYPTAHNELTNTSNPDSHPMSAITGLNDALSNKVSYNEFENGILNKADVTGTISQTFTFNSDQTGNPTENVELVVSRGSSSAVSIRWNETDDRWEFTNDGNQWFEFSNAGFIDTASSTSSGTVKLTVDPVNPDEPIAIADNDTRILTVLEKNKVLEHINTTSVDPHNALGALTAEKLPSHDHVHTGGSLGAGSVGAVQIEDTAIIDKHLDNTLKETLVRKTAANTVSDVLTFNPITQGVPFVLGINSTGQLVPGLNAQMLEGKRVTDFANNDHNHDTLYSNVNHNHDTLYATLNHTHSGDFASSVHNHDTVYSSINHTHSEYALSLDLTTLEASVTSNYLTKSDATSLYALLSDFNILSNNLQNNYLTSSNAAAIYAQADHVHNDYALADDVASLTVNVSNNYLTKTEASSTYVTKTEGVLLAKLTDLDNYVTSESAASTYALDDNLVTLSDNIELNYLKTADANLNYSSINHEHPEYALDAVMDAFIAAADSLYARKSVDSDGTFTTVDGKIITIADGVVTSIVNA